MDRVVWVLGLTLGFILFFTRSAVQRSLEEEPIRGGILSQIFHMASVALYIGVFPVALFGSVLVSPLYFGVPLALALFVMSWLLMLMYGLIECAV